MRRSGRVGGAAVLALVAVLGGCSEPPRPGPSVSTPTSASPRPAPESPSPQASPIARSSTAPPTTGGLPGFVVLTDVDRRIHADIRYATAHNFVGRPIAGYREPLCLLTRQAAEALRRVQDAALAGGHSLKVYDCYRPQPAVDDFVAWSKRPGEQQTKAEFYPDLAKDRLFADGYIGAPTAHSRGSTLDLTLVDEPPAGQPAYVPGQRLVPCTAPPGRRFADNSVDMGTGFDCFDARAHTDDPRITGAARDNRQLLRRLMTAAGFVNYDREWWHYSLRDEPHPRTYFAAPVARSSLG